MWNKKLFTSNGIFVFVAIFGVFHCAFGREEILTCSWWKWEKFRIVEHKKCFLSAECQTFINATADGCC